MEADRFERTLIGLDNISGISDLSALCSNLRPDGLPQDWVDDLPNLTEEQAVIFKARLETVDQPWAVTLHGML